MTEKKESDLIEKLMRRDRFFEDPESEGMIPLEMLAERGVVMPEASELDDATLHERLWQVIEAMASLGMYLEWTDHMSDRELYRYLREEALPKPDIVFPDDPMFATILSPSSGGGEPEVWLRYYADDEDREIWLRGFPDFEMPPKEDPPFGRDHLLPSQMERLRRKVH